MKSSPRLLSVVLSVVLSALPGGFARSQVLSEGVVGAFRAQAQGAKRFSVVPVAAAPSADEHLVMGNPSDADSNAGNANNYLIRRPEYDLSYNSGTGTPNWVSWHLNASWLGDAKRSNKFRADADLPPSFVRVTPHDYAGTGFDKGHMCNSDDRTRDEASNEDTFLMTNMVPQAPKNNEDTWGQLEAYSRTLAAQGDELYIVSGPAGKGGEGRNGALSEIRAARKGGADVVITVPAVTWKVILVLPHGATSPQAVTAGATAIAVIMPNTQEIGPDWTQYVKTVADVENLTHLHFFSAVDPAVAAQLKHQSYRRPN